MVKLLITFLALLLSFNAYPKGGKKISRPVTTDISIEDEEAHKDRLTLNVEDDVYSYANTNYLSPTLTFSSHGWSVGVGSQNIPLAGGAPGVQAQNYQNDTYFNLSKTFKLEDYLNNSWTNPLSMTLGSQTGIVLPVSTSTQPGHVNHNTLHEFYFEDNDYELIKDRFSFHAGPYWVNQSLSTLTSYWGYQSGAELVILPKKLRFNFDLYSGHSNVSGRIYQMTYTQHRELEYFFGYGEPASASGNHPYAILGFNLIGIFGN